MEITAVKKIMVFDRNESEKRGITNYAANKLIWKIFIKRGITTLPLSTLLLNTKVFCY